MKDIFIGDKVIPHADYFKRLVSFNRLSNDLVLGNQSYSRGSSSIGTGVKMWLGKEVSR